MPVFLIRSSLLFYRIAIRQRLLKRHNFRRSQYDLLIRPGGSDVGELFIDAEVYEEVLIFCGIRL